MEGTALAWLCRRSRPRGDVDPGRHTGADSVRDLHALLGAASVAGPYLLVGFSFGGLLAIMYAGTYPDQVMGLVSLDGSLPTDDQVDQLIPKDERAQAIVEQEANQSGWSSTAPPTGQGAGRQGAGRAGHLPGRTTVRAAHDLAGEAHAGVHPGQAVQFTKAVPNGRLVEVQSSHDINLEQQPELVIKEINRILKLA